MLAFFKIGSMINLGLKTLLRTTLVPAGPETKFDNTDLDPETKEACLKMAAEAITAAATFFPSQVREGLRACKSSFINENLDKDSIQKTE